MEAKKKTAEINSPEDESRLANLCNSNYVAAPEVIDDQQVMPFSDGDLRSVLSQSDKEGNPIGALNESLAAHFFQQIAVAVKAAHSKNISHRDIKPENILLTGTGKVMLTDFGFARKELADDQNIEEKEGNYADLRLLSGTLPYIPPDSLLYNNVNGQHADTWALGVTLTEMLLGENHFAGKFRSFLPKTTEEAANAVNTAIDEKLTGKRKAIAAMREKGISPDAIDLVKGLLHKDPRKRLKIDDVLLHPFVKTSSIITPNDRRHHS